MKKLFLTSTILLLIASTAFGQETILDRVDKNMSSKNRIIEAQMTIYGKRNSRTLTSKTWSEGTKKSLTQYLTPATEKGTKMLKLEGRLWIYSPSTDRTIQISGNMLRQSVMGSDLSYEDMMDDRKLTDLYTQTILDTVQLNARTTYLLQLTAKVEDVAYFTQKMWVDAEHFVPLQQELYAKSGQLLKTLQFQDLRNVSGRWFPHLFIYKDMLKEGNGTQFLITTILFNQDIPDYIFTKAALKQ